MERKSIRDPETYAIIGACMEIHSHLGHGFLEPVYQDAAVIEFPLRNIPFEREVLLPVQYKQILLPTYYRTDFVCFTNIIVEFVMVSESLNTKLFNTFHSTCHPEGAHFDKLNAGLGDQRAFWSILKILRCWCSFSGEE
jgi:GxxExxY protein